MFIWDKKDLQFWEALIQEETYIVSQLGGEGKGKGNNCMNRRKEFLEIQITCLFLAIHGGTNSKEVFNFQSCSHDVCFPVNPVQIFRKFEK